MKNEKKLLKLLAKAKDVLSGIACEQGEEALAKFGGSGLLDEIDAALGFKPWDGVYHVVKYRRGKETLFGICTDADRPNETWVLTGMRSADDAVWAIKAAAPDHDVALHLRRRVAA